MATGDTGDVYLSESAAFLAGVMTVVNPLHGRGQWPEVRPRP